jgi:hypothetical protein
MRGIKAGWYAMEQDGDLSPLPFSSRQESKGPIPPRKYLRPNSIALSSPTRVEGGGFGGPIRSRPLKDKAHD